MAETTEAMDRATRRESDVQAELSALLGQVHYAQAAGSDFDTLHRRLNAVEKVVATMIDGKRVLADSEYATVAERTRYACGFLFSGDTVLLIEKQRPAWQRGFWNGVGGHIEPGETPLEAMRRECREETGVDVAEWEPFATIVGERFEVTFFRATLPWPVGVTQTTDERPDWWFVDELPATLPNLTWLIPMARHETAGRGMPFAIAEAANG
jgi:8-oxo-dGTP pyrophosphatase MutT (NUDIX family)